VDDEFLLQIRTGLQQLIKYYYPIYIDFRLNAILESTTFAEVSDNVAVVLSIEDIMESNDMRMI
jgi:hypothetical protein